MTISERQAPAGAMRAAASRTRPLLAMRIIAWAWEHLALLAVFLTFALSALVVPILAPVATTDDWAYARSAQILLDEGRLTVFPVVAATAVFQIIWGALFGLLLGSTLGIFRLSTLVITALGGLALYGLCHELGVSRERGALGVAAYLFNPLVFVLAFTFMTDAHFTALLVVATWLFVKGVGDPILSPAPGTTFTPNRRPEGTRPCAQGEGTVVAGRDCVPETPSLATAPPLLTAVGEGGRGVRALRERVDSALSVDGRFIVAGSVVAALAFLTRQQGALIVPGVLLFLLLTRRLRFNRGSLVLLLQVAALPALTIGGYFFWLRFGNDVPEVQVSFFREMLEEGWSGTWWLVRRLTVVEVMYIGFFTLPLMAAALPFVRALVRGIPRRGWLICAVWIGIAGAGVVTLWMRGGRMPYIAQFFGAGGLGPADILGSRPHLLTPEMRGVLTAVCLAATSLLALVAARATRATPGARGAAPSSPRRARAGLVLSIGLWQVIGVLPPSYHYIGWAAGSLDRYLLPLAPLAIALALWTLRGVRLALPLGWVVAVALALFSVAGTRDYLVLMREVWAMGDRALAAGVPLERLDAGSGWDGYHLYEYGLEHGIRSRTPKGGPWWVYFYAPATDSAYVVAGKPLPRYAVVEKRPYSSWLQRQPTNLYLLRRWGAPWPPRTVARPILNRPLPAGVEIVSGTWVRKPARAIPTVSPRAGLSTATEGADETS